MKILRRKYLSSNKSGQLVKNKMIQFSSFNASNLKTFDSIESIKSILLLSSSSVNITENPNSLCSMASQHLQTYLANQTDWIHNFGLTNVVEEQIIGKMFGVLIVENKNKEIGYLAAFSGKLAGKNHHPKFVPPVFDG